MDEALTVRRLTPADAGDLSAMLERQPAAYVRYFIPFAFDAATISGLLGAAHRDLYMGLYWGGELAGFFMLRGWDDGYTIPAYGVTIDEAHRGRGLARLSLELSKVMCRLRGAEQLMLKVHPDNAVAKGLYERFGFRPTGVDARNGNLVYQYDLA